MSEQNKNRNIQFLRGISILLVLMMHGGILLRPGEGDLWHRFIKVFHTAIGVDLFFLISGFLMGATFLKHIERFSLAAVYIFYKKRIRRVLVPTWFWAGSTIVIAAYSMVSGGDAQDARVTIQNALSAMVFMGNFYNVVAPNVYGYFWSIGVEVQFYLFFPLLLIFGRYFWASIICVTIFLCLYNPFPVSWLFR